jgi:hypothetical protein
MPVAIRPQSPGGFDEVLCTGVTLRLPLIPNRRNTGGSGRSGQEPRQQPRPCVGPAVVGALPTLLQQVQASSRDNAISPRLGLPSCPPAPSSHNPHLTQLLPQCSLTHIEPPLKRTRSDVSQSQSNFLVLSRQFLCRHPSFLSLHPLRSFPHSTLLG